jgi:hypothetical protein
MSGLSSKAAVHLPELPIVEVGRQLIGVKKREIVERNFDAVTAC